MYMLMNDRKYIIHILENLIELVPFGIFFIGWYTLRILSRNWVDEIVRAISGYKRMRNYAQSHLS